MNLTDATAGLRRPVAWVALAVIGLLLVTGCGSGSSRGSGASTHSTSSDGSGGGAVGQVSSSTTTTTTTTTKAKPLPPATHTSCTSVVYIGDSTSDGESDPEYVPDGRLRAPAQLHKIGVKDVHMEVSGARSIVETFEGIPNGATVAQGYADHGYRGCWVLALGTNDAADVNAGSNVGLTDRIHEMMHIIGNQPVMWINVLTIDGSPEYYEESGMHQWDEDLIAACRRYPSMRVMNWAALAKPQWFISDGVHYTTDGYEHRTKLIAQALVKAFPRGRPASASCQVR